MKQTLLIVVMVLISGCGTMKYNYAPEVKKFNIPVLGAIEVAGIGEQLLDQGVLVEQDVLTVPKDSAISVFKIKKGKLIKVGADKDSEYYGLDPRSGVIIFSDGLFVVPEITSGIRFDLKTGMYCVVKPMNPELCGEMIAKREKETIINSESFRRTLIYTGKVGNKLRMSYREFNNNLARAAFSTDVEYDLSESNIIGYAGAKIEVIKATNNEIEYKVLNNFKQI